MSTDVDEIIFGFGDRFRAEREKLDLTQEELASKIATTSRTIISYESNKSPPKLSKLILFASLGADVGYIITGQKTTGAMTPDETSLIDNYRNSTLGNRSVLRKVGAALEKQIDDDGEMCA